MTGRSTKLKTIWVVTLFSGALLISSLSCGANGSTTPTPMPTSPEWTTFHDGAFNVDLPDWPEIPAEDEETLRIVARGDRGLSISRHVSVPRLLAHYMAASLPDFGPYDAIEVNDATATEVFIDISSNEQPLTRLRIALHYCGGFTYLITGSAPEAEFEEFLPTFEEVRQRIYCSAEPHLALSRRGLIGLVLTASGDDFNFEDYRANVVEARQAGIQATHSYISWGQVESADGIYDWSFSDLLLDTQALEGLRISLVIEFIHSSVPGDVPEDLAGKPFDDPEYIARAADFATAVAERYGDQIDYLSIGNEVNIYLQSNPDDLEPYLAAYSTIRRAVRIARPDLPVGTVIAFHDVMNRNNWDIIDAFKDGDFLAYTYYPHEPGFRYDVATDGFNAVLESMLQASEEVPFIVVENGFSSSPDLGSDEGRQARYIRDSFSALTTHRSDFNWHVWFSFHDMSPRACNELALSFVPGASNDMDTSAWNDFEEYLCSLGLKNNDGSPKQAWDVLLAELSRYQGR
jgi:hypothetical protein